MSMRALWPDNPVRSLLPLGLVLLCFLISRTPLLLHGGFPFLFNDTAGYWRVVESLLAGNWPDFTYRTPGYPLLLAAMEVLPWPATGMLVLQHAATLAACLFLVHASRCFDPRLTWWAAVTASVHVLASGNLVLDSSILPDSLFASSLIALAGFLLLFLRRTTTGPALSLSLASCFVFLWRPSYFLLLVLLGGALVGILQRRSKVVLPLLAPLLLFLVTLACYNGLNSNAWQPNASAAQSFHWGLSDLLEPDPTLPPWVNKAIQKRQAAVGAQDRKTIMQSWNPLAVLRAHEAHIYNPVMKYVDDPHQMAGDRQLLWRLDLLALRQNPCLYTKLFLVELGAFFAGTAGDGQLSGHVPFYSKLMIEQFPRTRLEVEQGPVAARHCRIPLTPPNPDPSLSLLLYEFLWRTKAFLFNNYLWPVLFLVSGAAGLAMALCRPAKEPTFWAVGLLFLLFLGQALQSAAILHLEYRYVFPVEFLIHLTPGFFWLWFLRFRANTKQSGTLNG